MAFGCGMMSLVLCEAGGVRGDDLSTYAASCRQQLPQCHRVISNVHVQELHSNPEILIANENLKHFKLPRSVMKLIGKRRLDVTSLKQTVTLQHRWLVVKYSALYTCDTRIRSVSILVQQMKNSFCPSRTEFDVDVARLTLKTHAYNETTIFVSC